MANQSMAMDLLGPSHGSHRLPLRLWLDLPLQKKIVPTLAHVIFVLRDAQPAETFDRNVVTDAKLRPFTAKVKTGRHGCSALSFAALV